MKRIVRLLGLAAGLILLFLAALLTSQRWLHLQTEEIRAEVVKSAEVQLEKTLALSHPGSPPWSEEFVQQLSDALGAHISLRPYVAPAPTADLKPALDPSKWEFEYVVRGEAGRPISLLNVRFPTPPIVRLFHAYQKLTVALLLFAVALLLVLVGTVVVTMRRGSQSAELGPQATPLHRSEVTSLAQLAKVSVQQGAELERERNERVRAEEDLHFKQVLLNRALEEKIRLGHDLHDGTIQALYATGLTLEAAKNAMEADPAEARRRLDGSLHALNTTIRDVRSYIVGLSPESLHEQSFAEAVHTLTQTLNVGKEVKFELRIDGEASARLNENQATNLLQIVREAISNGLRHGAATELTIRLHESASELCLLIQDNGRGFDVQRLERHGNGLSNMQARASRLGATLRLTSSLAQGTRLVLTLPRVIDSSP